MAVTPKILAEGQLSSTKSTLYTTPASTNTYIKFLTVYNTSATTQEITVYVNAGTSRAIAHVILEQDEYAKIIDKDESVMLSATQTIEAVTTTDSVVDFVISGVEQV